MFEILSSYNSRHRELYREPRLFGSSDTSPIVSMSNFCVEFRFTVAYEKFRGYSLTFRGITKNSHRK